MMAAVHACRLSSPLVPRRCCTMREHEPQLRQAGSLMRGPDGAVELHASTSHAQISYVQVRVWGKSRRRGSGGAVRQHILTSRTQIRCSLACLQAKYYKD